MLFDSATLYRLHRALAQAHLPQHKICAHSNQALRLDTDTGQIICTVCRESTWRSVTARPQNE